MYTKWFLVGVLSVFVVVAGHGFVHSQNGCVERTTGTDCTRAAPEGVICNSFDYCRPERNCAPVFGICPANPMLQRVREDAVPRLVGRCQAGSVSAQCASCTGATGDDGFRCQQVCVQFAAFRVFNNQTGGCEIACGNDVIFGGDCLKKE